MLSGLNNKLQQLLKSFKMLLKRYSIYKDYSQTKVVHQKVFWTKLSLMKKSAVLFQLYTNSPKNALIMQSNVNIGLITWISSALLWIWSELTEKLAVFLHLKAVDSLLPIFLGCDGINYLRYCSFYMEQIKRLKFTHNSLYLSCVSGDFFVKTSPQF